MAGKYALHFALKHMEPKNYNKNIKDIDFHDSDLNNSQREAVCKSLNSKHFFLIHGPFGTVKTKTLIEIMRQEALVEGKILITADSNAAVDNIAERLIAIGLNILRIGNDRKIRDDINDKELKNLIEEKTLEEISIMFNCSVSLVKNRLKKLGIEVKNKNIHDDIKDEEIRKLYLEDDLSIVEIAELFNVGHNVIYRRLKNMDINTKNKTYISDSDLEEIKKFYVEENVSIKEIADFFNLTPTIIRARLKEMDVKLKKGNVRIDLMIMKLKDCILKKICQLQK